MKFGEWILAIILSTLMGYLASYFYTKGDIFTHIFNVSMLFHINNKLLKVRTQIEKPHEDRDDD